MADEGGVPERRAEARLDAGAEALIVEERDHIDVAMRSSYGYDMCRKSIFQFGPRPEERLQHLDAAPADAGHHGFCMPSTVACAPPCRGWE